MIERYIKMNLINIKLNKGGFIMKKRWLMYIIIGVIFGIFDFYYQEFIQELK